MNTQNLILIVGLFLATLLGTVGGYFIVIKYEQHQAYRREAEIPANAVFQQIHSNLERDYPAKR